MAEFLAVKRLPGWRGSVFIKPWKFSYLTALSLLRLWDFDARMINEH
jgi:hypothetical protein